MKKKLEKAFYMALGSLLTVIGFFFGTIQNDSINLQQTQEASASPMFFKHASDNTAQSFLYPLVLGKIVCQKLEIVDSEGNTVAILGKEGIPGLTPLSIFKVYNANGEDIFVLEDVDHNGRVTVAGTEHWLGTTAGEFTSGEVTLGGGPHGAYMNFKGQNNGSHLSLWAEMDSGGITLFNKERQNLIQIGTTDKRGGTIITKDESGNSTGNLPQDLPPDAVFQR